MIVRLLMMSVLKFMKLFVMLMMIVRMILAKMVIIMIEQDRLATVWQ